MSQFGSFKKDQFLSFKEQFIRKSDEYFHQIVHDAQHLVDQTESPIEARFIMAFALQMYGYLYTWPSDEGQLEQLTGFLTIQPQYQIGRHRVDFAFFHRREDGKELRVAVECDGHDFHEKTKEQAARDKRRDRAIQAHGWQVLRFTGSEIHNEPEACAEEIFILCYEHIYQAALRERYGKPGRQE